MVKIKHHKTLSFDKIYNVLNSLDREYVPSLSKQVNIHEYAKKLANNASFITIEDYLLIYGIIAYYLNNNFCYISSFGLSKSYQGKGLAKKMFYALYDILKQLSIHYILLEVNKDNKKAINFYKNLGFELSIAKEQTLMYKKKILKDE